MNTGSRPKIMVIGHIHPDTDSVCSAIAYANLKNQISDQAEYEAYCTGELNQETSFVLSRFGFEAPPVCTDVRAQIQDIDIHQIEGVNGEMTMRRAWEIMRDSDITSLPITTPEKQFAGLISLQDIALANMDNLNVSTLSRARTSLSSLLETLQGELMVGNPEMRLERGKVVIGAGSPDLLEADVEDGDIVLLSNRYDAQLCAIEMNAACLVVCGAPSIAKTILKLAAEHGCAIIVTPFDIYAASCLINQSVSVETYMQKDVETFELTTTVDEAREVMGRVRDNYLPVLDQDGHYCGVISRQNLLNPQRKQLILKDHNEKTQCVEGYEQAEILEIIDHHRIGNLETTGPVFFRNQPVGCTSTIIYQMYLEENVTVEPDIAGILCCAILSDTLAFRSPTCTKMDEIAAAEMARIANLDVQALAAEMFEAGDRISERAAEDIFVQDYKVFVHDNVRFGVGQGSYVNENSLNEAKEKLIPYLDEVMYRENVSMIFYLFTSILEGTSDVIYAGAGSEELIRKAFACEPENGCVTLEGVVSRKKQFIPALLYALKNDSGGK